MERYSQPMDPADVEFFDILYRQQMQSDDKILSIDDYRLDARSIAEGVEFGTASQAPSIHDDPDFDTRVDTMVRFFLKVASGSQDNAVYKRQGLTVQVTVRVTTLKTRELERSVEVMIRNQ